MSKRPVPTDAELEAIADLEDRIVRAHDQQVGLGVPAEEVAHRRPAVVALAKAVGDRLRADYAGSQR